MAGLHDLKPSPGSRRRPRRVGRGIGSGHGKTAGRGHKGQKARSGGTVRPGFEGGQTPLQRRLPKRGFTNAPFKRVLAEVNVEALNRFDDDTEVTPDLLREHGLVKGRWDGVKVLGRGELSRRLVVRADAFSRSAVEKIQAAGGRAEVI
ncbi:MAG: 50S ribosomal protein L15 [Thermaerobacter sp.]|nr:50S ribosomal protein L15 [Bacillota bacterium]REJ38356.1 MAG: 50S ribosomal protein L15 [Bacillota bacterium]